MKNIPTTDVGDQYEDLALLLSQLNADVPKIQTLYKELQNNTDHQNNRIVQATKELDALSELTLQAIQEERDSAEILFKQYSATAGQALSDAKKLRTQLDSFAELASSTKGLLEMLTQRMDRIEAKLDRMEKSFGHESIQNSIVNTSSPTHNTPFSRWVTDQGYDFLSLSLQEKITLKKEFDNLSSNKRTQGQSRKKTVEIDYDEVTTAKALYYKYHEKLDGPLIIQRTNWYGDYAFVVDELYRNDTWVRGVAYVDGKFRRNTSYHADTEEFRMYNGPSVAQIKAAHNADNDSGELPF